jgi:hypothetical protein
MLLDLIKVIAAAAFVLVLWWAISGAWMAPTPSPQEPPRRQAPLPAPPTVTAPPPTAAAPETAAAPTTGADIVKLNDTIAKLTATIDRLNQQLAERDRPAKPSGSSSSPSPPTSDTARRQEIYARQTWRRPLWRESACPW